MLMATQYQLALVCMAAACGFMARNMFVHMHRSHVMVATATPEQQHTVIAAAVPVMPPKARQGGTNRFLEGPAASTVVWQEQNLVNKTLKGDLPVSVVSYSTRQSTRRSFPGGYIGPVYMDYKTEGRALEYFDEATPAWRIQKHRMYGVTNMMRVPFSVFYPPDPVALAKHNTGYIMVAVGSCCNSWNMTRQLLQSLLDMDDPVHVVLFDDNSKDGTPEKAAAMGVPAFTVTGIKPTGNTANMNRAWKYFTSYQSLQSLFIMNNDIKMAPGAFSKLHRCAMAMPTRPGVLGPISDTKGLGPSGALKMQNIDKPYSRSKYFNGKQVPVSLSGSLPGSLVGLNKWLEDATAHAEGFGRVFEAAELFGFFMGFRRDFQILDYTDNVLLKANLNFEQEFGLFIQEVHSAYVCVDVFSFHLKAQTLVNPK